MIFSLKISIILQFAGTSHRVAIGRDLNGILLVYVLCNTCRSLIDPIDLANACLEQNRPAPVQQRAT